MSFFVYPTVPGPFPDGSVTQPSITFILDPNTGLWRAGSGIVGVTGDGLEVVRFQAPSGANPQALFADGAVGVPSVSYSADPNTGLWRAGSGIVGVTGDGLEVVRFQAPAGALPQALFANGVVGNPSISFASAPTEGFWLVTATAVGLSLDSGEGIRFTRVTGAQYAVQNINNNGIISLQASGGAGRVTLESRVSTGTSAALELLQVSSQAFTGASVAQLGIRGTHVINQTGTSSFAQFVLDQTQTALGSGFQRFEDFRVGGTTVYAVTSDTTMPGQIQATNGSAARPAYSFLNATSSGMYWTGAVIDFALTGAARFRFSTTEIQFIGSANQALSQSIANFNLGIEGRISTSTTQPSIQIRNGLGFSGTGQQRHIAQLLTLAQSGAGGWTGYEMDISTDTSRGSGTYRYVDYRTTGTTNFAITADTTMPGQVQGPDGSAARPTFSLLSDPNTGVYSGGADILNISTGGTARYSATSTEFQPFADNTYALGAAALRWSNLFAVTTTIGDQIMREPFPGDKPLDQIAHIRLIEHPDGLVLYNIRTGRKQRILTEDMPMDDADRAIIARDRKEYGWEAAA